MLELNLFHEQQELQRERDFDPVRLTILAGILAILIIGLWGSILYFRMGELRSSLAAKNAELKKLTAEFAALGALTDFPKIQSQAKSLDLRIQNRIPFATQLDILADTIPTNIQVRTLKTNRHFEVIESVIQGRKGSTVIRKSMPALDLFIEVQARGKDKVEVLQMRDSLIDRFRHQSRFHDWVKQVSNDESKTNLNEVIPTASIAQDPKSGEPALGMFEIKLPMALKDEPKDL